MKTQAGNSAPQETRHYYARVGLLIAGVIVAASFVAWAQSFDDGAPLYPGAPAYDSSAAPIVPLSQPAMSALPRLQNIRSIIDRAPDLTPARRAAALADVDLAIYSLQNSNAPDASAPRTPHPIYESQGQAGAPIYDNTQPRQPQVPFDRRSAAVALRQLGTVIEKSAELNEATRKRTSAALEAAAGELESGR